jgi:hypothetical protein
MDSEWISGDSSNTMTYGTSEPSQVVYHHASRSTPMNFTDNLGSAEDATVYLGTLYVSVTLSIDLRPLTRFPG